jgi:hypothetical protein
VPHLGGADGLDSLVRQARRALVPGGRLCVFIARTTSPRCLTALRSRLRLNGFTGIRATARAGGDIVEAALRATAPSAS